MSIPTVTIGPAPVWGNGGTPAIAGAAPAPFALGGSGTAARDAALPDLAATTANTNSLQSLASLLAAQGSSSSASSAASASDASADIPAPALPTATDHGSHDESALHVDLGLDDGGGGDPSQSAVSA